MAARYVLQQVSLLVAVPESVPAETALYMPFFVRVHVFQAAATFTIEAGNVTGPEDTTTLALVLS